MIFVALQTLEEAIDVKGFTQVSGKVSCVGGHCPGFHGVESTSMLGGKESLGVHCLSIDSLAIEKSFDVIKEAGEIALRGEGCGEGSQHITAKMLGWLMGE
jgi:hypothetical protein